MLVYQYLFELRHSLLPYFLSTSPIFSGKTLYDLLFGKKLNYSMLRTFGCLYLPNLHDYSPHKLSLKSITRVFLGYSTLYKGFQCFDRQTHCVYVFHHVKFFKTIFSHIDGLVFNMPSTNDYNIFSECAECVSSPSSLPCSDSPDQSLLVSAASLTQHTSLFVPSSATIASTSPEFS